MCASACIAADMSMMASKLAPFRDRGENSSSPSCDVRCLGVQCGVNASFNSPANESQSHQDSLRADPGLPVGAVRPHLHSSPGARSMRTANTVVLGVGSTNVAPRRTESCWNVTGSFPAKPRDVSAHKTVACSLSTEPETWPSRYPRPQRRDARAVQAVSPLPGSVAARMSTSARRTG